MPIHLKKSRQLRPVIHKHLSFRAPNFPPSRRCCPLRGRPQSIGFARDTFFFPSPFLSCFSSHPLFSPRLEWHLYGVWSRHLPLFNSMPMPALVEPRVFPIVLSGHEDAVRSHHVVVALEKKTLPSHLGLVLLLSQHPASLSRVYPHKHLAERSLSLAARALLRWFFQVFPPTQLPQNSSGPSSPPLFPRYDCLFPDLLFTGVSRNRLQTKQYDSIDSLISRPVQSSRFFQPPTVDELPLPFSGPSPHLFPHLISSWYTTHSGREVYT